MSFFTVSGRFPAGLGDLSHRKHDASEAGTGVWGAEGKKNHRTVIGSEGYGVELPKRTPKGREKRALLSVLFQVVALLKLS